MPTATAERISAADVRAAVRCLDTATYGLDDLAELLGALESVGDGLSAADLQAVVRLAGTVELLVRRTVQALPRLIVPQQRLAKPARARGPEPPKPRANSGRWDLERDYAAGT
jgi:hypothetical protein